jgi:MerR family redox-sensitive transcriptional activator SoxR
MDPVAELLQIGEVARASGRAASSIRYYERIGLIPAPRRVGGRRRYPRAVLRTLAIIDTAQRAGLTLDEIRPLLAPPPGDLAGSDPVAGERLRLVAARKLPEARALIERAELVARWLEAAARCACPSLDNCQLFAEPGRLPAAGPGTG